tara:strand:+ start:76 stop:1437 length:1362 start_codon:yes stop_codon:yes gene_type:complete
MASKALTDLALQLYKSLGGNLSKVLGTRTNVNFLGKGKSPVEMVDGDINPEALGFISQSKAVGELDSAMGFLTAGKLNDVQANKLINNMKTMKEFYMPSPGPANITDLATGTKNLDAQGIMTLRRGGDPTKYKPGDPITSENFAATGFAPSDEVLKNLKKLEQQADDLGLNDPTKNKFLRDPDLEGIDPRETILPSGEGLELLRGVKNKELILGDVVNKIYLNAGVGPNAQPVVRANAREFLNRIKDLEDPTFPEGPTLASAMTKADFKAMTEGGGGGLGDPFLLVQKYFGPRVAAAVAKLDTPDDIQLFAERLVKVRDGAGRTITDKKFDPTTVDIEDFEFADGGRVPYFKGRLVGKALGLAKRREAIEKGLGEGFAAAEEFGITGPMVTRLFKEIAMDPSLVGKEKTEYFKMLNQALKNPRDFPDEIMKIQQKLGIDVGMKEGGLAKILEV